LKRFEQREGFFTQLKQVVQNVFLERELDNATRIRIVRLVVDRYPQCGGNCGLLAVYDSVQKLAHMYYMDVPIDRLLPVEAIFLQSSSLD